MQAEGLTRLVVTPSDEGLRLDQLIASRTTVSRRHARRMIEAGLVWRNQTTVRVLSRRLEFGDVVDVLRPATELGCPAQPEPPSIRILFEDQWLLVADKPAGVLSQPKEEMPAGELALDQQLVLNLAVRHGRRPFLRLVHRLDRQTSGTVTFARTKAALRPLATAWRTGRAERLYLAVVQGEPDFELLEIDSPIGRDPDHAWRFRVDSAGKPARTSVELVAGGGAQAAVVACALRTGRTHQVRVHLASVGHPVMGDRLYGARPATDVARPLLHATRLALPHPKDGRRIEVRSSTPADMARFLTADIDELLHRLRLA